jgi:hypothetical protein
VKGNFDRRLAALESRLMVNSSQREAFLTSLSDLHLQAVVKLYDRIKMVETSQQLGLYELMGEAIDQLAMGTAWHAAFRVVHEALDGL